MKKIMFFFFILVTSQIMPSTALKRVATIYIATRGSIKSPVHQQVRQASGSHNEDDFWHGTKIVTLTAGTLFLASIALSLGTIAEELKTLNDETIKIKRNNENPKPYSYKAIEELKRKI